MMTYFQQKNNPTMIVAVWHEAPLVEGQPYPAVYLHQAVTLLRQPRLFRPDAARSSPIPPEEVVQQYPEIASWLAQWATGALSRPDAPLEGNRTDNGEWARQRQACVLAQHQRTREWIVILDAPGGLRAGWEAEAQARCPVWGADPDTVRVVEAATWSEAEQTVWRTYRLVLLLTQCLPQALLDTVIRFLENRPRGPVLPNEPTLEQVLQDELAAWENER